MHTKHGFWIAAVFLVMNAKAFSHELSCTDTEKLSNHGMHQCNIRKRNHWEGKLKIAIRKYKTYIKTSDGIRRGARERWMNAFNNSHESWIRYRQSHCTAMGMKYYGGAGRRHVNVHCLMELTRSRTKEILRAMREE